jgi:hypothetical protein
MIVAADIPEMLVRVDDRRRGRHRFLPARP